ncbi:N(6)-adenosine-methyltransferase catalytic subunit METTL3-like [Haliotis cracherodii]|uniref:N(6)-adenosine-methyltransferase catalytic subunit METTL3-like n=1 Tax=Haliotis cracherodii TaxID=6455 RepID=UPI0039EC1404
MSDTWDDIQAVKSRHNSLRAKLLQRKREREGLVAELKAPASTSASPSSTVTTATESSSASSQVSVASSTSQTPATTRSVSPSPSSQSTAAAASKKSDSVDPDVERNLLLVLCDFNLEIPSDSRMITELTTKMLGRETQLSSIEELLQKFAAQQMIKISTKDKNLVVNSLDLAKLSAFTEGQDGKTKKRKRDSEDDTVEPQSKQQCPADAPDDSIESLLSMQSAKEREEKKVNEEILQLLSKPTAKEQYMVDKFRSRGGVQLQEFCQYGTREECVKVGQNPTPCKKLHFRKIIHKHTDESLGDCSFLNTCFHMDTCKYVHYEIDYPDNQNEMALMKKEAAMSKSGPGSDVYMYPPQWIQCDLRIFDMTTLGKCAVVMADPPWDIHMELPYGTMSDDEMRRLDIPGLQDEGFIFLWVTGRAMELGRECLDLWGYKRCDEVIWVKTNQLQRIIRTGRTGHWLNHGKEHCLVGVKGNPKGVNKGLDCDVIVAEVRATSHKPDEIYGIIERLSPGTRKCELFGRPHNVQPNWITLGNQVEGVRLKDPDVVKNFKEKYPDGNCLTPPQNR